LFHGNGFGEQPVGNAEPLRIAVDTGGGRRRKVTEDDGGLGGRQTTRTAEQHVVVAHQIGGGAGGVPPVAVIRRAGRGQSVPGVHPADDRVAATLAPEHFGGAVIGRPQHDVEGLLLFGAQLALAVGDLHQQVVGDEQFAHRGHREGGVVAAGEDLPGAAVEQGEADVGAVLSGLRSGFLGAHIQVGRRIRRYPGQRNEGGRLCDGMGVCGQQVYRADRCVAGAGVHLSGRGGHQDADHGRCGAGDQHRQMPSHVHLLGGLVER
jgi:hypothetical protein